MKKIKTIVILSLMLFIRLNAQDHSSVENLSVSYLAIPSPSLSSPEIHCIPQATITLKSGATVSKIYFKIVSTQTNEALYQVSYSISASPITGQSGFKLFEVVGSKIYISNGEDIILQPYRFEVETEDTSLNRSSIFSSIQ